jgi:hypothetical protein
MPAVLSVLEFSDGGVIAAEQAVATPLGRANRTGRQLAHLSGMNRGFLLPPLLDGYQPRTSVTT